MFSSFHVSPLSHARSQHARRACDACRSLKIKCYSTRPITDTDQQKPRSCNPCKSTGLRCTYRDKAAKRGRPRKREPRTLYQGAYDTVLSAEDASPRSSKLGRASISPAQSVQLLDGSKDDTTEDPSATPLSPSSQFNVTKSKVSDHDFGPSSAREFDFADPCAPGDEEIWATVNEFFDAMYMIFPVVSYTDVTSRLLVDPDWRLDPDFRTLIYAMRLLSAAARYRIESRNATELNQLIRQVESSRLSYHFADPATLNAVVCSLCLFTAYNVLEKHNRSFLYLDEALSLYQVFEPSEDEAEEQRRLRIGQVLYNTESAALTIYAHGARQQQRKARKPVLVLETGVMERQESLETNSTFDRIASHLLDRLTRIYLAEDSNQVQMVDVNSEPDMRVLFGGTSQNQCRYSRIQSADVAITRQWQLSQKLISGGTAKRLPMSQVESLGITAMSWICCLAEGDLRIVGLGKIAGLALNISALADGSGYQEISRGLAGAVIREDHEGRFGLSLVDIVAPIVPTIPLTIQPCASEEWCRLGKTASEKDSTIEHTALGQDAEEQVAVDFDFVENLDTDDIQWFFASS